MVAITYADLELDHTFGRGFSLCGIAHALNAPDEYGPICPGCGELKCECPKERDQQCACGRGIDPDREDCLRAGMCESCLGDLP